MPFRAHPLRAKPEGSKQDRGIPEPEFAQRIEAGDVPEAVVVVITGHGTVESAVQAMKNGAYDYVTKPFHMEEILARLRALVRRAAGHASSELVCGPVLLDTANAKVTVNGKAIKLTSLEFRLLSYLM